MFNNLNPLAGKVLKNLLFAGKFLKLLLAMVLNHAQVAPDTPLVSHEKAVAIATQKN